MAEKSLMVKEMSALKQTVSDLDNQKAELEEAVDAMNLNMLKQQQVSRKVLATKFDNRTYDDKMRQTVTLD